MGCCFKAESGQIWVAEGAGSPWAEREGGARLRKSLDRV